MSSEINRAIELIEEKIEALQKVRDTLVEMFDGPDSLRKRILMANRSIAPSISPAPSDTPTSADVITPSEDLAVAAASSKNFLGSGNGNGRFTRKDEIAKFIQEHGGSVSRADIIAGTGIPKGTVAYVLNDISRFRRHDHKWRVREQKDSAKTSVE